MCWAGRALRWRGAVDDGLLARPERPRRCTLPITAFRVTLPSSAAIWLAESPASQSFLSCSTRSSDQVITVIALFPPLSCRRRMRRAAMPHIENPSTQNPLALAGREKRARTCTQTTKTQGVRTAARDVVPDSENATICRDSRARIRVRSPHVPSCKCCNRVFHCTGIVRAGQVNENRCCAALTGTFARLRCLHAPPEKAAVLFSTEGCEATAPMRAPRPAPTHK